MKKFALLVAAGSGTRMGMPVPKQFLPLQGKPLFLHAANAFLTAFPDLIAVVVLPEAYLQTGTDLLALHIPSGRYLVATGGDTRFHSVRNGLRLVPDDSICFVHDAVRCLVSPQLILRCYEAALASGSAIPAIASTDSLRLETGTGTTRILDRSKVRLVQTPQTFRSHLLKKAFLQAYHPSFTDEASVVEASGEPVHLVEGEVSNLKITTPLDLLVAGQMLAAER